MNPKAAIMSCANTFAILKKWDKAIIEYENLIVSYGDDAMIYEPLHRCYVGSGDSLKAKYALEKAIKFTPEHKIDKINLLKEKYKTLYGKDYEEKTNPYA
jgi:tetratricopeptide (TPR) repeat protein